MRGIPQDLEIRSPGSLAEALEVLGREPGAWQPLAGGTDLMVLHEAGVLGPRRLLDLGRLEELREIRVAPEEAEIGAGCSYMAIQEHPAVVRDFPMLAQAARETGAWAIQERGTLGGNLANASPAADGIPVLMAYGATLRLSSRDGDRLLPVDEFFLAYRRTALRPDELITGIVLPRREYSVTYFRKVGARRAQAISKVVLAGAGSWEDGRLECRLGIGSVAPVPLRLRSTEDALGRWAGTGDWERRAVDCLMDEISPIDDIRSTAAYRRAVAANLLLAFLRRAEAARGEAQWPCSSSR
jgi:CO/xanthine dehydrogenase FAD-binding subunit